MIKSKPNKIKKIFLFLFFIILLTFLYTSSLIGVSEISKKYLLKLDIELVAQNYSTNYFVISGRRWKIDNYLLNTFGGASAKSKHLEGKAIDIIVLDINKDNKINSKDVDIVYTILNEKIIKNNGGIGTYKKEKDFFSKQMVHFDCRGKRARWTR